MAAENTDGSEDPLSDWEGGKALNEEVRRNMSFTEPAAGTPAHDALVANKRHTVTQMDKHLKRHIKRVKKKHLIGSHKKEKRKDRANIKGKVIDGEHEQYILTMGMMMGIRVSVTRSQQDNSPFRVRDFAKVDKLVFPPSGSTRPGRVTPAHQLNHTFKFKDYAPRAFGALRTMFGVDPASYMNSVCGDFNFIQFIANSRSGQFFFYSHDGQYMIKTQTQQENKFLRRILPHYYRHMVNNPDSMVCRFYGMHRVKMYHLRRKLHFVVMRSVVDTACKIHTMYDLKGSTVGRVASEKDRATGGVLKDQDLLSDGVKFELGDRRGSAFVAQLRSDASFLSELKIMDFSLLVGIHDRTKRKEDEQLEELEAEEEENRNKLKQPSPQNGKEEEEGGSRSGKEKTTTTTATVDAPPPPPPPPLPPAIITALPPPAAPPSSSSSPSPSPSSSSVATGAKRTSGATRVSSSGGRVSSTGSTSSKGGNNARVRSGSPPNATTTTTTTTKDNKSGSGTKKQQTPTAADATSKDAPKGRRMSDPAQPSTPMAKPSSTSMDDSGKKKGSSTVEFQRNSSLPASTNKAAAGAGGGGSGADGGHATLNLHSHHRHSNTPLLRAKEIERLLGTGKPAPTAEASPSAPRTSLETIAGGVHNPETTTTMTAATLKPRAKSASFTDNEETTEDDVDSDESSDSDDEDGGGGGGLFGAGAWRPFGHGAGADADQVGVGGQGLPVKPLGELDDVVDIPAYNPLRPSALASRRDGGMNSRRNINTATEFNSSFTSTTSGGALAAGSSPGSMSDLGGKGDFIYFVGIIDILQQYNSSKKAETFLKSFSKDVKQISCVPPDQYANRFVNFLKDATVGGSAVPPPVQPSSPEGGGADQEKQSPTTEKAPAGKKP